MKKLFILFSLLISTTIYAFPKLMYDQYTDADRNHYNVRMGCDEKINNKQYYFLNNYLKLHDYNQQAIDPSGFSMSILCLKGLLATDAPIKERVDEWVNKFPDSIYPHIAKGTLLLDEFSTLRGDKYISQTPKEQLILAFKKLEEAAAYMDNTKKLSNSPLWYQQRLKIAFFQERSTFFKILKDATTAYPDLDQLYITAAIYMKPEWGFSYKMLDDFAVFAMNNNKNKEEVYAGIYRESVTPCCSFKLLNAGSFNIKTFQKGMFSYLKKYPTQLNYNRFANAACLLGDKESAKYLIEVKMENYFAAYWSGDTFDKCVAFLKS